MEDHITFLRSKRKIFISVFRRRRRRKDGFAKIFVLEKMLLKKKLCTTGSKHIDL